MLHKDSHQSCIRLQIGAGICDAVLIDDAVTAGEINNYFDLANFSISSKALTMASLLGCCGLTFRCFLFERLN